MSIADRITSMSNNLSSAYDGIEYLGVDITGVDKNLQNLSSMLNVVYEGLPKVSDEGVSPSIVGSRVGRLNTTLKASDTTQFSTTGKQLIPITNQNFTISGITFKAEDNTIKISGTATANINGFSMRNDSYFPITLPAGSYYLTRESINSNITINLVRTTSDTIIAQLVRTENTYSTTFELTETTKMYLGVYIPSGANIASDYIGNIMVSTEGGTYEPYTGGIPSPNPDYPQNIHVVKGNNTVEVCGENLFSSEWEQGGILNTTGANIDNNNVVGTKGYIAVRPNQHYSIQRSVATSNINVRCYDKNKSYLGTGANFIDLIYGGTSTNPMQEHTNCIISPKDGVYYLRFNDNSNNLSTQYMMVKGDYQSGLVYEAYNGTTYPINLPQGLELCKISTYQDKLFKAILGDTVYDSLTSEQKEGLVSGGWYKYGEIGKLTLNGTEGWIKGTTVVENHSYFYCSNYDNLVTYLTYKMYSKYFGQSVAYLTPTYSIPGCVISGPNPSSTSNLRVRILVPNSTGLTTTSLLKTWLGANKPDVYYVLATPTITQITDSTLVSQLENLYKAMSKNGQTNILQTNTDNPFIIYASALKGG